MKIAIKVPQLPESVSDALLLTWHKKVGEFVKREENLIDLETDKVVMELPAPESGSIVEILVSSNTTVHSGDIIAYLEPKADNKDNKTESSEINLKQTVNHEIAKKITAMPAAAKIANENNISVESVSGSGKDGRILKEDVLQQMSSKTTGNTSQDVPETKPTILNEITQDKRIERTVPMTSLRKRIASRLIESQNSNAILTTFNEVNMSAVINIRKEHKDTFEKKHKVKLGFMSFFVKAVTEALKVHPIINASVVGTDIHYHDYCDIGVAVSSERGLIVPILRNAECMTIAEIETSIMYFAKKAQAGKIELTDITGGTFTISNGGTFGSMMSTPIINPPQSGILGMHAIKEKPIAENGVIIIAPMMYLALSYDHRIIDGKDAVLFLVAVKEAIENPIKLLLLI